MSQHESNKNELSETIELAEEERIILSSSQVAQLIIDAINNPFGPRPDFFKQFHPRPIDEV
jgi:hypothetical protein